MLKLNQNDAVVKKLNAVHAVIVAVGVLTSLSAMANKPIGICDAAIMAGETGTEFFSGRNFPDSEMWVGNANSQFSGWAAETAQQAATDFKQGLSLVDILNKTAAARLQFQSVIGPTLGKYADRDKMISVWRLDNPTPMQSGIGALKPNRSWPDLSSPLRVRLANLALTEHPALKSSFPGAIFAGPDGEYTKVATSFEALDGQLLTSSIIFAQRDTFIVMQHPGGHDSARILDDVFTRIDRLRIHPSESDFAIAMQGYFNAMPFYRGSAAIGRIVFSGLYLNLFGKTITLPPEIDLLAMILPRQKYIALVEEIVKK